MTGILGIVVALALLMYLAFRGISALILGPAMAIVAVLIAGGLPILATGGLDSLPHNGAVITLLAINGLRHREAYKDIFMVAVLIPIVALILLIVLGTLFGSF